MVYWIEWKRMCFFCPSAASYASHLVIVFNLGHVVIREMEGYERLFWILHVFIKNYSYQYTAVIIYQSSMSYNVYLRKLSFIISHTKTTPRH